MTPSGCIATITRLSVLDAAIEAFCVSAREVIEIPNIASAAKRLRQSEKRRGLNRLRKAEIKRVVKQIRLHVEAGDKGAAVALLPQLAKAADKAAQRNTIHANRAARIKSRWTKIVQGL